MLRTVCNNCNNEIILYNEDEIWTRICEECGHIDDYKHSDGNKCKKCGSNKLVYPDLEKITCPKCKKKGTYKSGDLIGTT